MTGKTIVYFVTKIRIVFELAIFSANIFLKSIFFLINQIAKRGQKLTFPQQTPKNDRKKRSFSLAKIQKITFCEEGGQEGRLERDLF